MPRPNLQLQQAQAAFGRLQECDVAALTGLSRRVCSERIRRGHWKATRIGSRTFVSVSELRELEAFPQLVARVHWLLHGQTLDQLLEKPQTIAELLRVVPAPLALREILRGLHEGRFELIDAQTIARSRSALA